MFRCPSCSSFSIPLLTTLRSGGMVDCPACSAKLRQKKRNTWSSALCALPSLVAFLFCGAVLVLAMKNPDYLSGIDFSVAMLFVMGIATILIAISTFELEEITSSR